jgi:hypothetical protein
LCRRPADRCKNDTPTLRREMNHLLSTWTRKEDEIEAALGEYSDRRAEARSVIALDGGIQRQRLESLSEREDVATSSFALTAPYLFAATATRDTISRVAGVAYVSVAMPFVEPLKTGIDLLMGSSNAPILEVGMTSSAWDPETGYVVVMQAPKGTFQADELWVDPADYRLINADGKPIKDYPYMVLRVQASPRREDWPEVPGVAEAYQQL